MRQSKNTEFQIIWKPFLLNPTTPPEGYNLREYLTKKYGPQVGNSLGDPNSPLQKNASKLGIAFNIERRIVNTIDAHRLIEYTLQSAGHEKQNEIVELICDHYFRQAHDISQKELLLDCAKTVGLNMDEVARLFEDKSEIEKGTKKILAEDRKVKSSGIQGVPFFQLSSGKEGKEGKEGDEDYPIELSGAQPPEAFLRIFQQL
eukprot:c21339_g1_i1.p1 GENE.c21339_g1_i1~~c21339_g1_i1.p1  ORF type:complete len:203 (-),score=79.13 c21339_g1_i1:22-630(-)